MVNRKDRYREYTEVIFDYKYPFTWEERSFNYLVDTESRDWAETQDYMFPPKTDDISSQQTEIDYVQNDN